MSFCVRVSIFRHFLLSQQYFRRTKHDSSYCDDFYLSFMVQMKGQTASKVIQQPMGNITTYMKSPVKYVCRGGDSSYFHECFFMDGTEAGSDNPQAHQSTPGDDLNPLESLVNYVSCRGNVSVILRPNNNHWIHMCLSTAIIYECERDGRVSFVF